MNTTASRLEKISFGILVATIILSILAFWPSAYVTLDVVKTSLIVFGTLLSAILFFLATRKERSLALPPKSIFWTSALIFGSFLVSSLSSIHVARSLTGQGFELGTTGFLLALFISGLMAFFLISRNVTRVMAINLALMGSYIVLFVFHLLRFILGGKFMSFGLLGRLTDTFIGSWLAFGMFSALMVVLSIAALSFLNLTKGVKAGYWVLAIAASFGVLFASEFDTRIYQALIPVLLGLTIFTTALKPKLEGGFSAALKRVAWIPLIALVVMAGFAWKGTLLSSKVMDGAGAQYKEVSLPWQYTLDVVSGSLKVSPIFGIGPNTFDKAYQSFKPSVINNSADWDVEFSNGFGLIPTMIATLGLTGLVLVVLLLVFFGIIASKVLRRLPEDSVARFIIVGTLAGSVFMTLLLFISVPPHPVLFLAFLLAGSFLGASVHYGLVQGLSLKPLEGTSLHKAFPAVSIVLVVVAALWGAVYMNKVVAFSYFSSGLRALNEKGDIDKADKKFKSALAFVNSDVFYRAMTEVSLAKANRSVSVLTSTSTASTTQAAVAEAGNHVTEALKYADLAVKYDPSNYYNYLSQARVAESAVSLKMDKMYEKAVESYTNAANINPGNPSIYLNLARLHASQEKYDDALSVMGVGLQVKRNYLDGIYFLSQIYAAKGDLANAVTAAKVATDLNPQEPVLFFQLGLLKYNNKDYTGADESFGKAVALQADYANAKYFQGLSKARLGKTSDAIMIFNDLSKNNPENQELAQILSYLQAGKSIFNDATSPVSQSQSPEKRQSLPIKEDR